MDLDETKVCLLLHVFIKVGFAKIFSEFHPTFILSELLVSLCYFICYSMDDN